MPCRHRRSTSGEISISPLMGAREDRRVGAEDYRGSTRETNELLLRQGALEIGARSAGVRTEADIGGAGDALD